MWCRSITDPSNLLKICQNWGYSLQGVWWIFKNVPKEKNHVMDWQISRGELIMCYQMQRPFGATLEVSSGSGKKKNIRHCEKVQDQAEGRKDVSKHQIVSVSVGCPCSGKNWKHSAL